MIADYERDAGTYFNDHSSCWGNDVIDGKTCPGKMPRGPVPVSPDGSDDDYSLVGGPVVIEGENETIFLDNSAQCVLPAPNGCLIYWGHAAESVVLYRTMGD